MTHLVGVRITNFGPFRGEHELDLGPGCYGVTARHADDERRSNGLGKSFFTAAIRWGLDGGKVERKDSLEELISEGEDSMAVELEFSDAAYLSRRKERGKAARLEVVVVCSEPGDKTLKDDEAQEYLDRFVLGIGAEDRESTCWALQKELDSLLRKPSGFVTKMMEGWLGDDLAKLVDAGERVGERLGEKVREHQRAVEDLARLEACAKNTEELEAAVRARAAEFDVAHDEYERALEAEKNHARRELASQRVRELAGARASLEELKRQKIEVPDVGALEKEASEKIRTQAALTGVTRRADAEKTRLSVLVRGEFDGSCPVSKGFECPAKSEINARAEPHRKMHQEAAEEFRLAAAAEKAAGEATRVASSRLTDARRLLSESDHRARRIADLVERLAELEGYLSQMRSDGIEPLGDEESPPQRPRVPSEAALFTAKRELEEARKVESELPAARRRVEETAGVVRAHRLAAELLGPAGARRVLLKGAVDGVELEANARMAEAGVLLAVRAAWGRETKELAEQCPACGAAFPKSARVKQCERCGSPRGLKMTNEFRWRPSWTSGAGLDLAGLGLRAAGFRFLKEHRGIPWSVAVLDEPTSQMDEANRRAVAAGIRKLLIGTFEQALITAHDQSTVESCDKRILITGHGSDPVRSKIEVVGG